MPKISALNALATAVAADVIAIVDTDVVETKKITFANLEASIDLANCSNATAGFLDASDIVDEDNMVSDSAALVPTQQSVKAYVDSGLSGKENVSNKATSTSLGTSNTAYPSQNAVKVYVDTGLGTKQATLSGAALTAATVATGDKVLIQDADDTNNLKTVTAQSVADLANSALRYETIWIDAGAMKAATTSGAATADVESTTNKVNYDAFDFDASADESVHFKMVMPYDFDDTNFKVKFVWTDTGSGSGDVVWGIQALPIGNDDAIDAAFLTAATVTDTLILSGDAHVTSATADLTLTGHTDADVIFFKVYRDADNVADTFSADARLLGVHIQYGKTVAASEW